MAKWAQGIYEVKNPDKYVGNNKPKYRSGWELSFMRFCDTNENVLQWASESINIPYRHPLTGKQTIYVPDFLVVYKTKNNTVKAEVVEIKPSTETTMESARSYRDKLSVAINMAKWAAADNWARANNMRFRVITEYDIFRNMKR